MKSQPSLERLKLRDHSHFKPASELAAVEYEDERYWTTYKDMIQAATMANFFDAEQTRPFHVYEEFKRIKTGKKMIVDFLKKDIIYFDAEKYFPRLREYGVLDLEIDVKEKSIYTLAGSIPSR